MLRLPGYNVDMTRLKLEVIGTNVDMTRLKLEVFRHMIGVIKHT
jgi:hypothetical protein